MLLLSSLHIHRPQPLPAGAECEYCIEHHCGGHINTQVQTIHDCLLCQFLSLPKMVTAVRDAVTTDCQCKSVYSQYQAALPAHALGTIVPRGPPAV